MKKIITISVVGIIGLIIIAALISFSTTHPLTGTMDMSMGTSTQATSNTKTTSGIQNAVLISNFTFAPTALNVKVGTKVTWVNDDSVPHTVTADNAGPTSGTLYKGDTYSYTFTTKGIYGYHCSIHPSMKGTVIVN